ncbi:sensor histidine kinase KdpD [uncultured Ligilactobacillus sp.]|uniref:sensor histidine kinase n=1 Tax=uncultured Ligilactobacillus sp. TaxID=2837633 RepID=UPI00272B82B5|nr:HAMP domain-containing sensor histidine kinase [uncultured Ligilactobacillus sp.]
MISKYTMQQRILLAVLEVIIGSLLVVVTLFLGSFLLVQSGQLRIFNEAKVTFDKNISRQDITKTMKDIPYDYTLYDAKTKHLLTGKYASSDLNNFEIARDNKRDLTVDTVKFKYFADKNYILIIRQNSMPEFADQRLRVISYNQFSYLFVTFGILLVIVIVVVKLVRELEKDFRYVEEIALSMGEGGTAQPRKHVKIVEFEQILTNLYKKSDKLAWLVEKERLEKKDLSFQIAALAHDVKTPLTVVKGNVELLEMTSLTSKQIEYLASLKKSMTIFERYFNSMLTYTRLLNDDKREEVKVSDFISELVVEFNEIAKTYQVELQTKLEIESKFFCGDRLALSRAVLNIFVNACQHAKKDAGKVTVTFKETATQLIFEVWNNGAPFSKTAKKNATKLFFTENGGRNLDRKNYGIGLAFAKAVSLKHGGYLKISDPPAGGAKVKLCIEKI